MAAILRSAGFKHFESLRQFSARLLEIPAPIDDILGKIWICHMDLEKIPDEENCSDSSKCSTYFQLYMIVKEKANEVQAFGDTTQFNFDLFGLLDKIYNHFGGCITEYIFTECHIFYNWGINSFEPVINVLQVQKQIHDYAKSLKRIKALPKFNKSRFAVANPTGKSHCSARSADVPDRSSPDLFEEEEKKQKWMEKNKNKKIKFNSARIQKIYKKCSLPIRGIAQSANDPTQERFTLNKILYDMKQRPRWPKNHILQKNSVEELLKHIVDKKIKSGLDMKNYIMEDIGNWQELKKHLKHFLNEHSKIEKYNGYGRILQHHLKMSKDFTPSNGNKLTIIPKTIVASYILDILRKVLPIDFFGGKSPRKKYFSEIVKIINGSKCETFIWHPIIQHLTSRKSEIKWCKEIKDDFSRDRVILKISKWLVIDYIFVILKNNFFVSETNSSNYGLRFYRKNDIESVSFFTINDLLYYRKLSLLKSSEVDFFTIERKWVDTGVIEENDLKKKCKTFMAKHTEYKQPVADVRFLPKNDMSSEVRLITNILSKNKNGGKFKDKERKRILNILEKRLRIRNSMLRKAKLFLEFLVDKIGTGIKTLPSNPKLEIAWSKCIYLKQNFGKLYFVKADISDAFGSVNHKKLKEILELASAENCGDFLQLKQIKEWKFSQINLKLKSRISFTNRASENSVAVERHDYIKDKKNQGKYFIGNFMSALDQIVFNQRLRIKNKVYKLQEGLPQGAAGRFSPLLNELYYSAMDKIYFNEFLSSEDSVLLRGVDDYLLITSNLEKASTFFNIIYNGISDFNASFNKTKLLTNINEDLKIVPYLGLIFNVDDMTVNPSYLKYESNNLLSTMFLTDSSGDIHFKKYRFLERRSRFVTCLKLQPILMNKLFNDLATVRRIVFDACLMQANRILVLVKYLFSIEEINDVKIFEAIFKSLKKITNLIRRVNDKISREEISWLFCYAMLKTFQRFSGKFQGLLELLRRQLFFSENGFVKNGQEMILEYLKQDIDYFGVGNGIKNVFKNLASLKNLR